MLVAIIAPDGLLIPNESGGSVQIYLEELYHALQSVMESRPDQAWSVDSDIKLLSPLGDHKLHNDNHLGIPSPNTEAYRQSVVRLLNDIQPDIIQVENRPDFALQIQRKFPKAKVILNLHSTTFLKKRHISATTASKILSTSHAVVVNSHYLRRFVKNHFQVYRQPEHPLRVIYPGVNLSKFPLHQHKRTASFSRRQPLRLLFVGRIVPQKGPDVIIEAVRKLHRLRQPVQLTVVGKSHSWSRSYETKLKQSAQKLPITFAGFVPPSRISGYYAQADVFVCPSQRSEAFGMVNLEALASGLPVLGSRLGGIQEILREDCSIIIDRFRNSDAWQRQLSLLIRNPKRYRRLAAHARARAEHFTWQRTARHFLALYQRLAEQST